MEYMAVAYILIAIVLIGYTVLLRRRTQAVESERARLETKSK
jgi:hypothetical protein